jgi:segregation and condensation protein A
MIVDEQVMGKMEDDDSPSDRYIITIDNFQGPLDLLWELIVKSKMDITEVSLSEITEGYLEYLKLMQGLNVKIAVEFIWMASELLYYKSRALLPVDDLDDEYFVPPLPPELVEKLLEYKKFQAASRQMLELFDMRSNSHIRENDVEQMVGAEEYIDVSLFDLLRAFADVMESQNVIEEEDIIFDEILVSDRIEFITGLLRDKESVLFTEVCGAGSSRALVIASFLAILEMTKGKLVKIMQHKMFGEIRIFKRFIDNTIADKE